MSCGTDEGTKDRQHASKAGTGITHVGTDHSETCCEPSLIAPDVSAELIGSAVVTALMLQRDSLLPITQVGGR